MNSRTIAVAIVFAAITIVLNISPFKIPAPYAPFLIYQIWEIPIVAASLLFGFRVGFAILMINTIVLLSVFPGALPTGPLYNFAALSSTLAGVCVAQRSVGKRLRERNNIMPVVSSTILGAASRVVVMTIVNWTLMRYPFPIGFGIPPEALVAYLPVIAFFNATLVLYTIPLGYFLARAVVSRTETYVKN